MKKTFLFIFSIILLLSLISVAEASMYGYRGYGMMGNSRGMMRYGSYISTSPYTYYPTYRSNYQDSYAYRPYYNSRPYPYNNYYSPYAYNRPYTSNYYYRY